MTHHRHRGDAGRLAAGLGWFSIGLGLLELAAPRPVARGLGLRGQEGVIQAYGLRELANGVGLLLAQDRRPWIMGRLAGDALDVATLAAHARRTRRPLGLALGMASVLGATLLDLLCAEALRSEEAERATQARAARAYATRSGFPGGVQASRAAAHAFEPPADFRIPGPLRPWAAG